MKKNEHGKAHVQPTPLVATESKINLIEFYPNTSRPEALKHMELLQYKPLMPHPLQWAAPTARRRRYQVALAKDPGVKKLQSQVYLYVMYCESVCMYIYTYVYYILTYNMYHAYITYYT